jgi:hypothetical protein
VVTFDTFWAPKNYGKCRVGALLLGSQFSAIFDNFRLKNWRFSQLPML